MRWSLKLAMAMVAFASSSVCIAALAQMPNYNNVGRAPTQEEIKALDIAIGLDGKELPPGSGTAREGAPIYARKCAMCHGQNLQGGPMPGQPSVVPPVPLAGGRDTNKRPRTVGSWWPFATSVWDFINRAMPRGQEGSLSANEVYALTAFVLYKNDIIKENDVIDAKSLPKVQMPNRNGFSPSQIGDIHDLKKRGCRLGQCPESSSSK
jgi:S-disulfanyl-L-cysteine oxidoreductase SoxD